NRASDGMAVAELGFAVLQSLFKQTKGNVSLVGGVIGTAKVAAVGDRVGMIPSGFLLLNCEYSFHEWNRDVQFFHTHVGGGQGGLGNEEQWIVAARQLFLGLNNFLQ